MLYTTIMMHMSEALAQSRFRFKQLREMEQSVAWNDLDKLIEPHYLSSEIGRNLVIPAETMIRIFFLQHCYMMTPAAIEEALFQVEELRDFALIDLGKDLIPCEESIKMFSCLVSNHEDLIIKLSKTIRAIPKESVQ
ncbi:MAG TPA: hypothetical protein EYG71_07305 [Leucothrix sp.]|nr:hypothetical protein [Leucothrix sp.]